MGPASFMGVFTFFKLYKSYQIAQNITYKLLGLLGNFPLFLLERRPKIEKKLSDTSIVAITKFFFSLSLFSWEEKIGQNKPPIL